MLEIILPYLTVDDIVNLSFASIDFYDRARCYLDNPCFQAIYRINKNTKAQYEQFTWSDVFHIIMTQCSQVHIYVDNDAYCKYWSVETDLTSLNLPASKSILVRCEKCDIDYMHHIFDDIDVVHLDPTLPQRIPRIWCNHEFPPLFTCSI